MTPEEMQRRVDQLLDQMLLLPREERGAFLERVRREESEAHAALVEVLLAGDASFLHAGTVDLSLSEVYRPEKPSWPERLGDYRILREIGRGSFGVVCEAEQLSLGRRVALKIMHLGQEGGRPGSSIEHVLAEARTAGQLRHPNIVTIHDVGQHETWAYISMDLYPAGDLATLMPGVSSDPRRIAWLLALVARAVHYVHEYGVLHCDLKLGNILLEERDGELHPRVTDFGLAQRLSADSGGTLALGQVFGTPAYMAPEQATPQGAVSVRTDVYALGAVLYTLLTGKVPHQGRNVLETLRLVAEARPARPRQLNPGISRDLEAVCLKALARDPAARYASAEEMARDLDRYLDGQPVRARSYGRLHRWARLALWRPARTALVAAVSLLILLTPILAWVAVDRARQQARADQESLRAADFRAEAADARARAAEDQARRDRERARQQTVDAARASARAGGWRQALGLYRQAIDATDDPLARLDLEVEHLSGWFVHRTREELEAEVDRLLAVPLLAPRHRAVLLLHKSDLAFSDSGRQQEAARLAAQAWELRQHLPAAEQAYLRGLRAPRLLDARAAFEDVLRENPFHPRANLALLTALMVLGEHEMARQQQAICHRMQPHDAGPFVLEAWIHLLGGDRKACLDTVARINAGAQRLDPEHLARMRSFFTEMADLLDLMESWEEGGAGARAAFIPFRVAALAARSASVQRPFSFNVPIIAHLFRSTEALLWSYVDLAFGGPDRARARLMAAHDTHPEPILLALATMYRAFQVRKLEQAGQVEQAHREMAEMNAQLEQAVHSPSMFRRSSFRLQMVAIHVLMESYLLQQARGPEQELRARRDRLREQVNQLVGMGRRFPQTRRKYIEMILPQLEADLARKLLTDWQVDQDNSPWPQVHFVILEKKAGNVLQAFGLAASLLDRLNRGTLAATPAETKQLRARMESLLAELRPAVTDQLRLPGTAPEPPGRPQDLP